MSDMENLDENEISEEDLDELITGGLDFLCFAAIFAWIQDRIKSLFSRSKEE